MLTRLEADGFKNLVDFSVDFGPLTCIAGPNGVGKSNLFDAIEFLSLLADHTLVEAATRVRGMGTETGDLRDLFWTNGTERRDRMRLAAEMLVESDVLDDVGRRAEASSTFLRYEVEIGYETDEDRGGSGRLVLRAERLDDYSESDAAERLRFPMSEEFRCSVVKKRHRAAESYISTHRVEGGDPEISVHPDQSSGQELESSPARFAPRTIVGTTTTSSTPTILAARREMQSWRVLALEPSIMRRPDRFSAERSIGAEGGNLAATLLRLVDNATKRGLTREDILGEVATNLALLVPVRGVGVVVDDVRHLLTVEVEEASGGKMPASSLSDGTLRFLALAILAADRETRGLICLEEPENGMHPARLDSVYELLRDLVVDPIDDLDDDNTLRQLILATHSPAFVQLQDRDDILVAEEALVSTEKGRMARVLSCSPLTDSWRARAGQKAVGGAGLLAYLTHPPHAQLSLESVA